ncbi:FAD-dependent monooxygenase [Eoetvoesiella caeni]
MHQPSQEPHSSSYFKYEIFPFVRPPDMGAKPPARHPVVIVGAGPIGLVLAIQLARLGVKPVLIDSRVQVSGGSRALGLARRTMQIMDQSDVAPEFLEQAIVWTEGRSYYKNQIVHHLDIPDSDDEKFAPMTNLAQCIIEKILTDKALALGVDIRFQTLLQNLEQDADAVKLSLDTPDGEYQIEAEWLAACDGGRSTVRKLQQLRFEGVSFESRFLIADFTSDMDEPPGRRCYFDPPWLRGQTVLMHKAPRGVWRLDYRVPDDVSDEEAMDPKRIASHIQSQLDYIGVDQPWKIEWTTLYKPNSLTLASYNHGRVLYCGDAAHLLPVFGVRGMNTGVQDSINLAWKLAAIVQGHANAALLDTYSSERVADARQICVDAGRSTRMMAPPTRGFQIMQQAVLSLSLDNEYPRGLLHWRTSHPIDYADSVLTLVDPQDNLFEAGPRPGAPAQDARLDTQNAGKGFLLDHFEPGFQVLVFGANESQWAAAREDVRSLRDRGLKVRLWSICSDSVQRADADVALNDPQGNAQALWGASDGAIYVLRPDQHVASRWKLSSPTRAAQVIEHILAAGLLIHEQKGK